MRLLIAEDNADIRKPVTALLTRQGYVVDGVDNGTDALDYALTGNYDGIILDIMMPGKDGITVLRELRQNKLTTPVLMLTAKAEVEDRVLGLDAGADDYLPKPFAMAELLARLRAMLRRRSDFQPDILEIHETQLNKGTMEVSFRGSTVRLVTREYQVLEMLMENFGKIVTTDSLMEHIWGWDSDVEVNIVWVTVSTLRKKLVRIQTPLFIRAVRGMGYKMEVLG